MHRSLCHAFCHCDITKVVLVPVIDELLLGGREIVALNDVDVVAGQSYWELDAAGLPVLTASMR